MSDWRDYFEIVESKYIVPNLEYQKVYIYKYRNVETLPENLPMPPTNVFDCMFLGCRSLINIDGLKNWDTSKVISMKHMFYGCESLLNIDALSNWDTSNVKVLNYAFCDCESLTNLDALKNWNTNNVIDIHQIFLGCKSLTNIDALRSWNIEKVKNSLGMFSNCWKLVNPPMSVSEFKKFTNQPKSK